MGDEPPPPDPSPAHHPSLQLPQTSSDTESLEVSGVGVEEERGAGEGGMQGGIQASAGGADSSAGGDEAAGAEKETRENEADDRNDNPEGGEATGGEAEDEKKEEVGLGGVAQQGLQDKSALGAPSHGDESERSQGVLVDLVGDSSRARRRLHDDGETEQSDVLPEAPGGGDKERKEGNNSANLDGEKRIEAGEAASPGVSEKSEAGNTQENGEKKSGKGKAQAEG
eukprot:2417754-Rhodomonas_salina.2